jgi:hypothetical protein
MIDREGRIKLILKYHNMKGVCVVRIYCTQRRRWLHGAAGTSAREG